MTIKRLLLSVPLIMCLVVASAEVVYDGTPGGGGSSGAVPLDSNNRYIIDTAQGNPSSSNVFYSFSRFDIESGNTALFTDSSASGYSNLIARITDTRASTIAGSVVSEVPGANLWLINPHGLIFSQGAVVDVAGSFHASTADYVSLPNNIKFYSDPLPSGFTAVDGQPDALGISGNGNITLDSTTMRVGQGQHISLVGSEVQVVGSSLQANGGSIQLVSGTGVGEIAYNSNKIESVSSTTLGRVAVYGSVLRASKEIVHADNFERNSLDSEYRAKEISESEQPSLQSYVVSNSCIRSKQITASKPEFVVKEGTEGKRYFLKLNSSVGETTASDTEECGEK